VLTKEDKEGRLVLSKKRAQYERAWGTSRRSRKPRHGVESGPVIEVVKGGLIVDIGLRGFLPASLVELRRVRDLAPYVGKTLEAKIIELDKNRNNVVLSRRAFLEETQKEQRDSSSPTSSPARSARVWCRQRRQLRCVRRPRRHGRPHPRVRAVVEARRPPGLRRRRRRRGHRAGARGRLRPRAHQPVAEGHPAGSVAGVRLRHRGGRAGLRPGHQAGAVRSLRPGGRRHRGSRAHLGDVGAPRRLCPSRSSPRARSCGSRSSISTSQRRRISLSIKQAAEGGERGRAEYQEHFGEHAYDDAEGNYIG
jgi:small subunit ribosomal protein S1